MTPETLTQALRLRLPNTEIVLGDRPGRVVVKMASKPHALTIFVALSKSGDQAEVGDTDPVQRPRDRGRESVAVEAVMAQIVKVVTDYTTHNPYRFGRDPYVEPRLRAWVHLPDLAPLVKDRALALLDADRAALVKLRKEVALREEGIAALERALAVTP